MKSRGALKATTEGNAIMQTLKRHKCLIAILTASLVLAILLPYAFVVAAAGYLDPAKKAEILIPTVVQIFLAEVGVGYVLVTLLMWKKLTAQVKSVSRHNLAALSNEHNWRLLTFRDDVNRPPTLPIALPSWRGLQAEQWRWRVLHLEHLNLIRLAWEDWQTGVFTEHEIEDWVVKAKFIFQDMRSNVAEFQTGREQLQQLMRRDEGYPDEFRDWLVKRCILSDDLVPDRQGCP